MLGLIRIVTLALSAFQSLFSYMNSRTLVQKGRLERVNASLKESIRRSAIFAKISKRNTPSNDSDILDRM